MLQRGVHRGVDAKSWQAAEKRDSKLGGHPPDTSSLEDLAVIILDFRLESKPNEALDSKFRMGSSLLARDEHERRPK
jgi:hypothetical protein